MHPISSARLSRRTVLWETWRPRRDSLSAGTERLSTYRPCQIHLPHLGLAAEYPGGVVICDSTTRIPRRKIPNMSSRSRRMSAGLDSTGGATCTLRRITSSSFRFAERLINIGRRYVDSLTADEIREYRGTLTEPGKKSPYRDRSADENLDLLRRMRRGIRGRHARPASQNRHGIAKHQSARSAVDRIRHTAHYRTGRAWPIYPSYDFAHPFSDAIEGVTIRSVLWNSRTIGRFMTGVERAGTSDRPQQIEFARLNISHAVMSKRKLLEIVENTGGWVDDPRSADAQGSSAPRLHARSDPGLLRAHRRVQGTPWSKQLLEHFIREDLNKGSSGAGRAKAAEGGDR